MKTAEYDHIAQEYKVSKELPFRKYVETYSLFQMVNNLEGLKVLDLACGEGFYTRKLMQAKAKAILGVDISSEMIHLAEAKERKNPMGCRYMVHDVGTLPKLGPFDLVVAMYLLNYAKSKDELLAFCKAAYRQLKPGGLFIGVNDNPGNDLIWYESYRKYGFIKQSSPDRKEGDPIRYTFYNADGSQFQFNNYYLHPETYVAAFAEAGFIDFQWKGVSLDPTEQKNYFWDHFMAHPPIIGFSARKK